MIGEAALRQEQQRLHLEVVELRSALAETERQLENVRQTFVYRIGEAIVAARTWAGLKSLPRRLLRLRRAFLLKRRVVSDDETPSAQPALSLRYVQKALTLAETSGKSAAVAYIESRPRGHAIAKARALTEVAHSVRDSDPRFATDLGLRAARLNPAERRIRSLAQALFDLGEVRGPSAIIDAVDASSACDPAEMRREAVILAHRRQLVEPVTFPRAAPSAWKTLQLAIVTPRSLPQDSEGQAFRANSLQGAAQASGLPAFLVTPAGQQAASRVGAGTSDIVRLPPIHASADMLQDFVRECADVLVGIFTERRVSHVHAIDDALLSAAALHAARRVGATFLLDLSQNSFVESPAGANGEPGSERQFAVSSITREVARHADRVVLRSRWLAEGLRTTLGDRNVQVIDDGLAAGSGPLAPAAAERLRLLLGLGGQPLVGVGDLSGHGAGLRHVISAWPRVLARVPEAKLLLCEEASQTLPQSHLARELEVSGALLIADGGPHAYLEYLKACTASVFPEGAGPSTTPFQMQWTFAAAVPAVAVECPRVGEWLVDGRNGVLVAPGDPEALAEAIVKVLLDPPLADELARAGAETATCRMANAVIHPQLASLWRREAIRAAA